MTTKCKEAKSRQYRGIFKIKSRETTRQDLGKCSQQLEYKQVKNGMETGVGKGKLSLLACQTRCKYSIGITRNVV